MQGLTVCLLYNQAASRKAHSLYSRQHAYITLKVFERNSAESQRETKIYHHLNSLSISDHAGATLIRKALGSFQISTAEGDFQCLVHPPLGIRLYDFRNHLRAKVLPEKIVKLTLVHLLLALDYLHTEAGIVHTGMFIYSPSPGMPSKHEFQISKRRTL